MTQRFSNQNNDDTIQDDENIPEIVNDPDDELLTALLDDELDVEEKKRVESRLTAEPALRERLEKLRAASHLLDSLEMVPQNREITETTMELLTAVVKREIQAAEKRRRYHNLRLIVVVVFTVTLLFFLSNQWMKRYFSESDSIRTEADYPVFSRLDGLEVIQNIDFLKRLREIPFFAGSASDKTHNPPTPKNGSEPKQQATPQTSLSETDLRQEVSRFDSTEMFLRKTRFYSLSNSEREKYRSLYQQINESPEKDSLFALLDRFEKWFWSELSESDRYQFWRESEDRRMELIPQLIKKRKNALFAPHSLSDGRFRGDRSGNDRNFGGRFTGGEGERRGGSKGELFGLKKALPEELRNEKLDVGDDFCAFIQKCRDGENKLDGKRKREILSDFIREKGIDSFTSNLSEKGKVFLNPLSEDQKIRWIGLLIQVGLYEKYGGVPLPNKKGKRPEEGNSRDPDVPFPVTPRFGNDSIGYFWKTESTRDLAETLRHLPEKMRDELLNLPDDEMYSQLLILHWGFDPKQGPFSRGSTSEKTKNEN